jgi:hypothetical protein
MQLYVMMDFIWIIKSRLSLKSNVRRLYTNTPIFLVPDVDNLEMQPRILRSTSFERRNYLQHHLGKWYKNQHE